MIDPSTDTELQELQQHLHSGHSKKTNLCHGCLESEGPRKIHRTVREVGRATHALHIDIAGPFTVSDDGFTYFLVGALRMPGFPLMINVRNLTSRISTEVCDELEKMVAFFEALQSEGFTIGETSRIKRLHSDRAREFTAPYFSRFLANHKTIHHSFTSGYDPQTNGTAERAVGLVKSLASRCLCAAKLEGTYWSHNARYAAQSLLCNALQLRQKSFCTSVVAHVLGNKYVRFPQPRSLTGRLQRRPPSMALNLIWSPGAPPSWCSLAHRRAFGDHVSELRSKPQLSKKSEDLRVFGNHVSGPEST